MSCHSIVSTTFALLALGICTHLFAATITVTSTDDTVAAADGKVTLREAITSINAGNDLGDPDIAGQTPGVYGAADSIHFNIPGIGAHVITTTSTMTPISKSVFVNGYSQPGSKPNTNAFDAGINAVVLIEIAGLPGNAVLNILAVGTEVRGLAIHGGTNIVGASDVVIAGNFFGTDAAGTTALGVVGSDVGVEVGFSGNTIAGSVTIGGPADADRNLIVSSGVGVALSIDAPGPYLIQGNYIGTDITGTVALARGQGLLAISNARVVGNLISGNPYGGLRLRDNNSVQGNLIGTDRDGVTPLPNGDFGGIEIQGGNSTIGGAGAGEANVIAGNTNYGIDIYTGSIIGGSHVNTRNRISHNSIYANGRLGISLDDSSSVLLNDIGDSDTCAADHVGNDGQNYPVLTSATVAAGNATVSGTLNSISGTSYTLEFFANVVCDASGYGQGQTYIGAANVTTDASGNASFGPLTFAAPTGQPVITSTATDVAGNTSEFSQCLTESGGPSPTTTTVVSSLNPSIFGQSVTFTATVTGTNPTGTVQFNDGANVLGTAAVSAGMAKFTTSTLALGSHPISAIYSGDAVNAASTSATVTQVVAMPGDSTPTAEPAPTLSVWMLLALCGMLLGVTLHRLRARGLS